MMPPQLVDYLGRPVKTGSLTQELATVSIAGVRQPYFDVVASGLTPERLAQILISVDQGDSIDYLTLAEEMEERDLHYHSVLSTRKMAVSGLRVVVEATDDESDNVDIADECQTLLTSECATDLVADLPDAIGKGFAVAEIIWDTSEAQWYPKTYKIRDQRHFRFDRDTGQQLRLLDMENTGEGVELPPYKFIEHRPRLKAGLPLRGGLARLAVVSFMCKAYALKDWLAFAEVFGMPLRLGKYPQAASAEQKAALLSAVANIGTDAAAIVPEGMIIEFIDGKSSAGGDKLFLALADYLDQQVSKGVLGQTMTTDNGSSLSQAQVHNEVRKDILLYDARRLASTLRRDIVKPFVDLNYGPREDDDYPLVRLETTEVEDLVALSQSLPAFIDRGLEVQASVILDKFGITKAEPGSQLLLPQVVAQGLPLQRTAAPEGEVPPTTESPAGTGEQPPVVTPPPGEAPPEEPPAPQPSEAPAPQDQEETVDGVSQLQRELLRKVRRGEPLTADQRMFLLSASSVVLGSSSHQPDMFARLAETASGDWEKTMDPMLRPIIDLARAAKTEKDFLDGLETLELDPTELMRAIATLTLMARGIGDAGKK